MRYSPPTMRLFFLSLSVLSVCPILGYPVQENEKERKLISVMRERFFILEKLDTELDKLMEPLFLPNGEVVKYRDFPPAVERLYVKSKLIESTLDLCTSLEQRQLVYQKMTQKLEFAEKHYLDLKLKKDAALFHAFRLELQIKLQKELALK